LTPMPGNGPRSPIRCACTVDRIPPAAASPVAQPRQENVRPCPAPEQEPGDLREAADPPLRRRRVVVAVAHRVPRRGSAAGWQSRRSAVEWAGKPSPPWRQPAMDPPRSSPSKPRSARAAAAGEKLAPRWSRCS
jgi:hypothetical protein